ncbi:hypothetical protein QE152_g23337 [Popillia japonica]|uniref:Uncharacterized protein n=1 Tax=Popillia japonica TaxID=7064 RepID=A0AAW1KHA3_POPJA
MWRPWNEEREGEINNDNCEPAMDNINSSAKKIHLGVQAKKIVLNVYSNLREENAEHVDKDIIKRTSKLTGVCYSTVYNIVKHGIEKRIVN